MGLTNRIRRAVLAVFCLGTAVFSFAISDQLYAIEREEDGFVASLHPLTGKKAKHQIAESLQSGSSIVDPTLLTRLAKTAPLDPLLFEVKLVNAIARHDEQNAYDHAETILVVQPRSLAARLHLFNTASQRQDHAVVFEQYESLVRLRSLNKNLLSDALIGVFRENGDWSPLLEYLESSPVNGALLAEKLASESIESDAFTDLVKAYPTAQKPYLRALMQAGSPSRAYDLWQTFSDISIDELDTQPFNSEFANREALPPFNWAISDDRAELLSHGGLYVTYLGQGRPKLAEQVMAAPAGDYILRTRAKGRMPRNGGALEWALTCRDEKVPFASSVVTLERSLEVETLDSRVTIPEGVCDFQFITLFGRSGEFPKTSRTEILSVTLIPVD